MRTIVRFFACCLIVLMLTSCSVSRRNPATPFEPAPDYKELTKVEVPFPRVIANDGYIAVEKSYTWEQGWEYQIFDAETGKEIAGESRLGLFPGRRYQEILEYAGDDYAPVYKSDWRMLEGADIPQTMPDGESVGPAARYGDYLFYVLVQNSRLTLKRYDLALRKVKEIFSQSVSKRSAPKPKAAESDDGKPAREYVTGDVACSNDGRVFLAVNKGMSSTGIYTFHGVTSEIYVLDLEGKQLASIPYPEKNIKSFHYGGFIGLNNYGDDFIIGPEEKRQILSAETLMLNPVENQGYCVGFNKSHLFFGDKDGTVFYK